VVNFKELTGYSGGTVRDFHPVPYSPLLKTAPAKAYDIVIKII